MLQENNGNLKINELNKYGLTNRHIYSKEKKSQNNILQKKKKIQNPGTPIGLLQSKFQTYA